MSDENSDVKNQNSASSGGDENLDNRQSGTDEDSDKSSVGGSRGSKEDKYVPYSRFKEVNDAGRKATEIVNWYRENIGNPNDVVAFREWQSQQSKDINKQEREGDITEAQAELLRKAMRKASPEVFEAIEANKRDSEARFNSILASSEDEIRDIASEEGFPADDDKKMVWFGTQIMSVVKSDERLLRMWQNGNMACIRKAYKTLKEEYLPAMSKMTAKKESGEKDRNGDYTQARKRAKLPTLPAGRSTGGSPPPKRADDDKGLTKTADKEAWAIFQQRMTE
jgi:vacuolar-type H+-ATPase subunit H